MAATVGIHREEMRVTLGPRFSSRTSTETRASRAEQSGAQQIYKLPARTAAQPESFIGAGSGYNRREREDRGVEELDSRGYVSMPLYECG